jgi:hypothetical protein
MKILNLPDVLHEYLIHLLETHAARGIHPEEGMAIARLWDCVNNRATTIPDAEIEKMVKAGTPPVPGDPPSAPRIHSAADPHEPDTPRHSEECNRGVTSKGCPTCDPPIPVSWTESKANPPR